MRLLTAVLVTFAVIHAASATSWDYGYVSANVTVTKQNHRTQRAKAVSQVFAYCYWDQPHKAILADAQYQLMSTLRQEFPNAEFDITFEYVDSSSNRERAALNHRRDLADSMYQAHIEIPYSWSGYSTRCR